MALSLSISGFGAEGASGFKVTCWPLQGNGGIDHDNTEPPEKNTEI